MPRTTKAADETVFRLLSNYTPVPGVPDELMDSQGSVRSVWQNFLSHLSQHDPHTLEQMFARGDAYLRNSGVFLRQYTENRAIERPWPLSHMPVLIDGAEWDDISGALKQRADLLEMIVADLYGENRLVADGALPGQLIAQSSEWIRPLVGIKPRGGHFLNFIAFEISRGPDGTWWVLNDRTQAPSGAGYALETRVATSRIFAEHYATAQVHRLAGFFAEFRAALLNMRTQPDSHVAILTPGPFSETYFEQSYIARYLGLLLVEGEDLTIQQGQVFVRTVSGLQPVDVLWRRLDTLYADPLELDETSQIGTAGLVGSVRRGMISVVNALGAGILESRALLAFMPRISRKLTGEALRMPNIATWWCGQPAERSHVLSRLENMLIAPALSTRQIFDPDESSIVGSQLRKQGVDFARRLIDTEGDLLVGQEAISFSTSPAWVNGKLVPRPMSLRVFMVRTPAGWSVMPGGFARIGEEIDTNVFSMQAGSSVADVWIVSDKPVDTTTLLTTGQARDPRPKKGALPSQAAENLFWLARYMERAESFTRLARARHDRLAEAASPQSPLLVYLTRYTSQIGLDTQASIPPSLAATIHAALRAAGSVRDRLSPDGWAAIVQLNDRLDDALEQDVAPGDGAAREMGVLLRQSSAFTGLLKDNMYQFTEWRFLSIGRSVERLMALSSALSCFLASEAPQGSLDLALEYADSSISHRRRYGFQATLHSVAELTVLDELNPRSLIFHLCELEAHMHPLVDVMRSADSEALRRTCRDSRKTFQSLQPEDIDPAYLVAFRTKVANISDDLTRIFFS
ncbi:circularly permuted type 2 ATP-grasp protein [Henriciella marina]|uniref:circularly permuted type 2 ATP-grasp protein n=1 Tax=Henriciella marina TaxID=453851 RepID=UPI000374DD8D|nr:circularly permuted type 2 ATP-grasp protein [Henriciella marina]